MQSPEPHMHFGLPHHIAMSQESKAHYLEELKQLVLNRESLLDTADVTPQRSDIEAAIASLHSTLPETGLGLEQTFRTLVDDLLPGFSNQATKHYYGFVTGGVTPAAYLADNLVTLLDQNLAAHLPSDSAASTVEDRALRLLLGLFSLDEQVFQGRTITSGATASNVLGLACGREALLSKALEAHGVEDGPGELGLYDAMKQAQVDKVQVLACACHSSLAKAAAIVGIGRKHVVQVAHADREWDFDLAKLEDHLKQPRSLSIVAVNFGEVNTGFFTTNVVKIRELCDKYGAWLHIDGAFSIYARALMVPESPYFKDATDWVSGLELADSITGDAHKTLNVPYDCGFFFTRDWQLMQQVFQNPGAAYLKTAASDIPSAFNIGIENSRRFRALPVYATLVAYGRDGYGEVFERLIYHTRAIGEYIYQSDKYELLPVGTKPEHLSTIVLFRSKTGDTVELRDKINATRKMYVSGSAWDGRPAIRIAPCNWSLQKGDEKLPIEILEHL